MKKTTISKVKQGKTVRGLLTTGSGVLDGTHPEKRKRKRVKIKSGKQARKTIAPRVVIPSSALVVKHKNFIRRLYEAAALKKSPTAVKLLIASAKPKELLALCESASNVLRGTFPNLTGEKVKRLVPFKHLIRTLGCPFTSLEEKRKILLRRGSLYKDQQTGGVLPIIPLLAPIVSSLVGSAIGALV